jgi:S1-C subfamily serine protease
MEVRTDTIPTKPAPPLQARWQHLRMRLKSIVPFATGVTATLLALLIYSLLAPKPQTLTMNEVNNAVAIAMASATPAPAYSALVYQAIQPSLVLIQAHGVDSHGEEEGGLGSGVVISADGMILTALHVVENATELKVTFADGFETTAQVVNAEPENDIAVLQVEQLSPIAVPAVLGNPNAMRVGDEAFAVGNPFGLYGSMSAGVISGFERSFKSDKSGQRIEGLIQIDSAVNPGNSGGPLLNRSGQVVGIVVGILNPTDDEVFIGIGFAVPISTAGGAAGMPLY